MRPKEKPLESNESEKMKVRVLIIDDATSMRKALAPVLESDLHIEVHAKPSHFLHKGSIDMLFFSVAEAFADRSRGIILSGSGKDGAGGIREITRVGENTIVHDPETCIEPGMPEAALQRSTGHRVSACYEISRIHKPSLVP
jgi:chemotaxis response regulator CheB